MTIRKLKPNLVEIHERLFPSEEPVLLEAPVPLYRDGYERPRVQMKLSRGVSPQIDAILERSELIEEKLHKQRPGHEGGGQIVCVESLKHDDLRSGEAALPSAVFVLLDKPRFSRTDTDSPELESLMCQVWQGWVVAPDMEYMNEWDVLINDEELCEDDCQFVQTWNRVEVYIPTVHRVAGRVGGAQLANVRYLSEQFSTGNNEVTNPVITELGELVQRKLPHGWVQTGTLLNESDDIDPRNDYVSLYGQFAALFSEAVWSMLQDRLAEISVCDSTEISSHETIRHDEQIFPDLKAFWTASELMARLQRPSTMVPVLAPVVQVARLEICPADFIVPPLSLDDELRAVRIRVVVLAPPITGDSIAWLDLSVSIKVLDANDACERIVVSLSKDGQNSVGESIKLSRNRFIRFNTFKISNQESLALLFSVRD